LPIYILNDKIEFPPVAGAEDGIVAIGGDLKAERLIMAYKSGIFPWYSEEEPIIWHSPEQRFVLFLEELHISKSMKRVLNSTRFSVTFDSDFSFVINQCASVNRKGQDGTWIIKEMIDAYVNLHHLGYAHSVEVWHEEKIVGGVYGVSIGKCFFAESMFHTVSNASKIALINLVKFLKKNDFLFLDAQVFTEHVATMGAIEIPRNEFIQLLNNGIQFSDKIGKWHL
jgi:leucyl/phenylalanyl-tRNA--protein transferase